MAMVSSKIAVVIYSDQMKSPPYIHIPYISSVGLTSHPMENFWLPPPQNYWKINVHGAIPIDPQPGSNMNGIGVIVRYHNGKFVWGVVGTMPDTTPLEAQLWSIHMGLCHAFNKGKFKLHLETDNMEAYNVVDEMDFDDALNRNFLTALHQIFMCNPEEEQLESVDCEIFPISPEANHFARYLANFGLDYCTGLSEISENFGRVRELISVDTGRGVALPQLEIYENFGLGEVIDGPIPAIKESVSIDRKFFEQLQALASKAHKLEQSLLRDRFNARFVNQGNGSGNLIIRDMNGQLNSYNSGMVSGKGKEKLVGDFAFNNNGLLSKEAIDVLESDLSGLNHKVSSSFDLNKVVAKGMSLAAWLDKATRRKREEIQNLEASKGESSSWIEAFGIQNEEELSLSQVIMLWA